MNSIILKASLDSDLNWDGARGLAIQSEGPILWEFDFGFPLKNISLNDAGVFFSYTLALEQFAKTLHQEFKERSAGVVLYRGSPDVFLRVLVTEEGDQELIAASMFAEYFHRLGSFLPEEVKPFCLFEGAHSFSRARLLQLTSKDRFWHLELSLQETQEYSKGVLLPEDEFLTPSVEACLEKLLSSLEGQNYRVIPEGRLVEMWHGLDTLIMIDQSVSFQGTRKIMGFLATGGEVIKFGAEGFEPPTHCSQSSCASQTALCSERD